MDDTEAKGSKNQDDEDDDMWRLWEKTYDGKNTVALETEQKPKKEEEKSTAKAYQVSPAISPKAMTVLTVQWGRLSCGIKCILVT